jgi:ABC-type antimicrobial peptide transport system permease subunit
MLSYAVKRVIRSLGLFAALFLGVVLASTFFAGINIGADTTAKAALLQRLNQIPVDIVVSGYGSTSQTWANAASKAAEIDGVNVTEVISKAYSFGNLTSFGIVGVSNNSRIYDGLTVTSGASPLGENETYVWVGSKDIDKIDLDSTLKVNFTYWDGTEKTLSLSLKVVDFVELDDKAYSIATGELYWMMQLRMGKIDENLLIVSWERTFAKLLDAISSYNSPFTTQILVYLDRDKLINPWDISSSLDAIQRITSQVNEKVAGYGMSASNNLQWTLIQYQFTSTIMRLSFFVVGLPVFFVAWYVGTTVSNVSYNLRRREIGLLLTKGFSNGQLFRLFLSESLLIGVMGGLVGVGLGFLLSPIFATSVNSGTVTTPVLSQEVIIITIVFSLAITLLSTFRPSRKAARLPPIEALREYTYVEEVKPYKQRLPWVAFALGTYKIVMFLFGIFSIAQIFAGRPPPFTNIFLVILFSIWIIIDSALIFLGPLLFFWGFTKIFIRGSLKFQEFVTRAAKFLGDLGPLATRNVQRNPARAASIAFLIALIVGYSFQSVGLVASEQDYVIRRIKADVGADISVQLTSATNASGIAEAIANLTEEVESATLEYSFSAYISFYSIRIRAVDPEKWLKTAYYEGEWFSGNDAATAFQQMKTNSKTIILERSIATYLNKNVGDSVTLGVGTLTIVGFFGPEVSQQSYTIQPVQYYGGSFWSYIPLSLYETSSVSASSVRVLVKLKPGVEGKAVASNISSFEGVSDVQSVAEKLETYQSDLTLMGSMNILRVGSVFSILAASVATGLVTIVSLQERKREASIMSARGLSFKQLVIIFLTENLAIIAFSVFLGVVVGLITLRGYVSSFSATPAYSLVTHRMAFPPDAALILSICLILIFASAIIPVILLIKRYISKMERIVRF